MINITLRCLFGIIPFIMFMNCQNNPEIINSIGQFLDSQDESDMVPYQDIFKSVNIVPLELSENSLIKRIDKIIYYNDKFYILSWNENSIINCFNSDGDYIQSINNIGRGPNEYTSLSDIRINPFSGYLELLDPRGRLISYDTEENEFVNTISLYQNTPIAAVHKFLNISEDLILLYSISEQDQLFWFSRKEHKVVQTAFNRQYEFQMDSDANETIKEVNNQFVFLNKFTNSYYSIEELKYREIKKFDFGSHSITENIRPGEMSKSNVFTYSTKYQLAYPIFNYFFNLNELQFYYEGQVKNIRIQNENDVKNITGLPEFNERIFPLIFEKDEMIIGYLLDPKTLLGSDFYRSLSAENQHTISEWQENDNPLITIFSL